MLALFQELSIIDSRCTKNIIVISDIDFIKIMNNPFSPYDGNLNISILIIQKETHGFETIEYFHVLQEHSCQVDHLAKEGFHMNEGALKVKEGIYFYHIP